MCSITSIQLFPLTDAPRYTASATPNATVDVYVLPGDPRILSCAATGVPTPSIVGVNSSSFSIATNSYNIASASVSDAGLYICEASNAIGLNAITYRLNIGGENVGILAHFIFT